MVKTDSGSEVLQLRDKSKLYEEAIEEIQSRLETLEKGIIVPRMATVAAVLKEKMPHYLWCGFYFAEENEMVVGPYQGRIACPNIAYSGVCGTSVKKRETLVVPDVHEFPGHIVCDETAKSEIVVPIYGENGMIIGVFDVDSKHPKAFDEVDRKYLERLMPLLLEE